MPIIVLLGSSSPDPSAHGPFVVAQGLAGTGSSMTNLAGCPAAASNGLPIGLMLVGRRFEEVTLIWLARAIGASGDWKLN
jgi:Asp-tRNA(Asn)/Glu-tRNA(Gln) amidotransferase A subunit family amidase